MVKSAGNDGGRAANPSPLNPNLPEFDQMEGSATSKNNLVVAAAKISVDERGNIMPDAALVGFSSRGPTDDLRIKPDISGVGTGVFLPIGTVTEK